MKIHLVLINLFLCQNLLAKECAVKEQFEDIKKLSESLAPIISINETENISQFCQVNGYRDQLESPSKGISSWVDSFVAAKDSREKNFLRYFLDSNTNNHKTLEEINNMNRDELNTLYQKAESRLMANPGVSTPKSKKAILKSIDRLLETDHPQQKTMEVGKLQAGFLCKDLTFLDVISCANGVKAAVELARPVGSLALPNLWREIVSDDAYMQAFKKIALSILSNLKNKTVPTTTLMDDLKKEFSNIVGTSKADDYAWKTMALIATGGGNLNIRPTALGAGKDNEISDLLHVLSNGSMALDRLTIEKGFLYTFPKNIEIRCDYGKNYHFWMSAFLARELTKQNYNVTAAATAAFTVEKGYQFAKVDDGRDPTKPFKDFLHSNYNNNIRLDLGLGAAGSWYGATYDNNKNYKINSAKFENAIRESFASSQILNQPRNLELDDFKSPQPIKMLSIYSDWKKVISPDTAFKAFEKLK